LRILASAVLIRSPILILVGLIFGFAGALVSHDIIDAAFDFFTPFGSTELLVALSAVFCASC
jgi:hypothetical protein